jgi:transposase
MENEIIRTRNSSPCRHYSESFKRMVVSEFERGPLNKDQLQVKYCIGGNSRILVWCRRYGKLHYPKKGIINGRPMKDPQKQRIKELEQQLKMEKLKVLAYQKLIEITEQEEGISILKKDVTKQSDRLHRPTPEK